MLAIRRPNPLAALPVLQPLLDHLVREPDMAPDTQAWDVPVQSAREPSSYSPRAGATDGRGQQRFSNGCIDTSGEVSSYLRSTLRMLTYHS
jgi:hypothetical protein